MPLEINDPAAEIEKELRDAFEIDEKGGTDAVTEPAKAGDAGRAAPTDKRAESNPDDAAKDSSKEPAKPAGGATGGEKAGAEDKSKLADDKSKAAPEPPARWTAEEKKEWAEFLASLDANDPNRPKWERMQQILLGRNKEIEGFFGEEMGKLATQRKTYEDWNTHYKGIENVLGPRRQAILSGGETVEKVVADLFSLSDYATQRPEEFVRWFMQVRRLDPAKIGVGGNAQHAVSGGQAPGQHGVDPDDPLGIIPERYKQSFSKIQTLEQQLGQMAQQLQQTAQWRQAQEQQREQSTAYAANTAVQQFMSAADDHGQPKYPFYADVRERMADLLEKGLAHDLDSAYEAAVWANPTTRQRLMDSVEARRLIETQAGAQRKAAAATKAGGSIAATSAGRASGGQAEIKPDMTIEQMLAAEWDNQASLSRV